MITARLKGSERMNFTPSLISRMLDARSSFWLPSRAGRGIGSRNTISADVMYVIASNQSEITSLSTFSDFSASKPPSQVATTESTAAMPAARGNVPYDATRESVLADARFSSGTKWGTDASFAGPQSNVMISMKKDATTSSARLLTNGNVEISAARPRSHNTMIRRRSKRSTITPPSVARKKPGSIRAPITRLMAAADPSETCAVIPRMAIRPTQSPRLEKT